MLYLDQTFYQVLRMVAKYVLTYIQGTVKLDFNHTAPSDPVPVCSCILPPTRSNYCGQLVVNSQYRLTVNTPFSRDAVTAIFRMEQLVAVYTRDREILTAPLQFWYWEVTVSYLVSQYVLGWLSGFLKSVKSDFSYTPTAVSWFLVLV
jgi:hypothetical protein